MRGVAPSVVSCSKVQCRRTAAQRGILMHANTPQRKRLLAFGILLASLPASLVLAATQQHKTTRSHTKTPVPKSPPALVISPVPFRPGETLNYRVLFSKYAVNAASLVTFVVDEGNYFGGPVWHFRAIAHTQDTTRLLFPLDDQFDSYTSAENLASVQFEMYLQEQGKSQTSRYRMSSHAEPAPPDATAVRVLSGTRDAIGFLYALRAVDWAHTPEFRAPVFDGRRLYDVTAKLDAMQGSVTVPAGTLPASRIAVRLFDHGEELTDTHLTLWLGRDAASTPLLIQADIPFGTLSIELMKLP